MTDDVTTEHREALARVIDPDSWALSDDPRYDHLPEEARTTVRRRSLEIADRIIESGLMLRHEWDSAEYRRAKHHIIDNTSRRGYCYDVPDGLDGYVMHDPRCPLWPQSAVSSSAQCIQPSRR